MSRAGLEFSDKTKDQAAQRANGFCEHCGLRLKGRPEFHHILEAAFNGSNSLANCLVVCPKPCHAELSRRGIKKIRKADHQRRAANGAKTSKRPMSTAKHRKSPQSGPQKCAKVRKTALPKRRLYEERS